MKSLSLPFNGQPSFGFGIRDFVLTLCGCGMAIFIHFYILLGFLDLVADIAIVSYSWIYTHKWYSDVLNLFWDVFKYLPITTQVFILIRLYLLFYNLSLDNCDYTLHTSPKSYDEFFNSHK
jgi:hypothetical protein